MKQFKAIIFTLCILGLTSCDYTMYVAVRNYKDPCRVNVTYQKSGYTFFDKDTLLLRGLDNSEFDSSLIRNNNTSTDSYYFIAPRLKEIALRPQSLKQQPIKQVEIINSSDSSWVINLWDRKEFKKLKKSGQLKTKGFIFTTSILIENK